MEVKLSTNSRTDPKVKISEQIRLNVQKINNNYGNDLLYKNRESIESVVDSSHHMMSSKTIDSINHTKRDERRKQLDNKIKSSLKHSIDYQKEKNQKRVSFSKYISKQMKNKQNKCCLSAINDEHCEEHSHSDSDSDKELSIDLFEEYEHSWDRSEKGLQTEKGLIHRTGNGLGFDCDEEKGDPSRVIEITIDSEDEDNCEVIGSQSTSSQETDQRVNSSLESDRSDGYVVVKREPIQPIEPIDHYIPGSSKQTNDALKSLNDPTLKYFCVLCPSLLKSSKCLVDHYLGHCGVYLECAECHQKFSSLQAFRGHNSAHLERNNMLNLETFLSAKKWCDHYIEYEKNDIFKQVINASQLFCPVCHRISQLYNIYVNPNKGEYNEKLGLDEDSISNHLHQHLLYFPYECIDCKFEDKKTAFCLNANARQHIKDEHNVKNAFHLKVNELKSYFDRRKSITKLDNVITNCLNLSLKMRSFSDKFAVLSNKQNIS